VLPFSSYCVRVSLAFGAYPLMHCCWRTSGRLDFRFNSLGNSLTPVLYNFSITPRRVTTTTTRSSTPSTIVQRYPVLPYHKRSWLARHE
jgi:hypothetical protein